MTNKKIVEKYIEGFNATDHKKILSTLTDDVIWDMPGFFYHIGIKAFDSEIENDAFVGSPVITLRKLIEEKNIVVAEGDVKGKMKNGGLLDGLFCDVFEFRDGKICKLTTYMMHRKNSTTNL